MAQRRSLFAENPAFEGVTQTANHSTGGIYRPDKGRTHEHGYGSAALRNEV
jgi:hypothetical protein